MIILFSFLTSIVLAQEMTVRSVDLIRKKYLWYNDLEAQSVLVSAAEELEREISWMIVEENDNQLSLRKGIEEPFGRIDISNATMDDLESYLFRIAGLMKKSPEELGEDVDVELLLLDGFTREMDRYSVLMYRDSLRNFNERISGKFSGIGCRVQKEEKGLSLQEVFPDGPAFIGGLQEGDIITHVDEVPLSALTLQQGVSRLRGEVGTRVGITVLRGEESFDTALVRDHVRVPNVHWSVTEDEVGVITIRNFSEQTISWVDQALEEFKGQSLKGIIIDLRNNGGGSMLQSCKLVDRFSKEGLTLRTEGKEGKSVPGLMRHYNNKNDRDEPELPLIILVNGRSASASEIVSGSFKLLDRGLLVGSQTYGKGVVQTAPRVRTGKADDRVSFKMTVAQYILADDYSVHEKDGVTPHIVLSGVDFSEPPFVVLSNSTSDLQYLSDDRDVELNFAVEVLKRSLSSSVEHLEKISEEVIAEWQPLEEDLITEAYSAEKIDWQNGENTDVKVTIDIQQEKEFVSGETAEIGVMIHNQGSAIYRSYLWLQAEDSSSPWDDIIIPVGFIAEESAANRKISIEMPAWMVARQDEIQPVLLQQCCDEVELEPFFLKNKRQSYPEIPVSLQISKVEEGYDIQVDLENQNERDLEDLRVRIIWPNEATNVRMAVNEWEEEILAVGEKKSQVFSIKSSAALGELPAFLLRIDADGYAKVLRTEIEPTELTTELSLLAPQVLYQDELAHPVGEYVFTHSIDDDREINDYEAWFNGEKIHWQETGGEISLPLSLTSGHNNIVLYVTDDQEIQHKEIIKIFGLSEDYSKPHLEVTEEGDK